MQELARLARVAILAEVLGYHPQTVERHATAAAADYAVYVRPDGRRRSGSLDED